MQRLLDEHVFGVRMGRSIAGRMLVRHSGPGSSRIHHGHQICHLVEGGAQFRIWSPDP